MKQIAHFFNREWKYIRSQVLGEMRLQDIGECDGRRNPIEDGETYFTLCHIRRENWYMRFPCKYCVREGYYVDYSFDEEV